MKRFIPAIFAAAAMTMPALAQEHSYPIGTVVAPDGNTTPTREQQKFTYEWLSRAGLNTVEHELMPVAGGYLDWALINAKPGEYDWKPYDFSVEDSEASNLDVYLEVFTIRGMPDWLFEKYPDAYMQTPLGGGDALTLVKRDNKLDINSFPSVTHPGYIAAVDEYVRALAKRYKDRKRVRGYIIAEEFGLPGVWPAMNFYGIDFSPSMRDLFHTRLQEKYGTVDAMNKAWGQPGKYKDFKDVVWKRGWAHDPKNFRGEWMEYYQTLQVAFAEHHNRIARAIKQEDPGAIVMVSDYQSMVNRVGHGSYAALFKDVDAFGFKSYWNDVRMQMDFCTGITGGNKQIWCTNFSEDDTTRGGMKQRYMNSEYVRRQFWPAYARGMAGLFLFIWSPQQAEKMSLLEPQETGSLEPISSMPTVMQLREFMDGYQAELSKFKPERAHVVVHDPNLTYIGQHWDFAPKEKEREKWFSETPAIASFQTVIDDLAAHNRRFTVSTESSLASKLGDPATRVLALTGSELLDAASLAAAQKWIESGKPTILDERSGKYDEFSRVKDGLQKYRGRSNVLTLIGDRWDRDKEQRQKLGTFLAQHQPLRYSAAKAEGTDVFTVDYMTADDGAEMAIITRRGPHGRAQDQLDVQLRWQKPHAKLQVLDPFATRSQQSSTLEPKDAASPGITLKGFQDVLLVIGR